MSDKLSMHCIVKGLVQGVWYRANTLEQAKQLGLTGWVRNLPDGTVEVIACGQRDRVLALHAWLQKGPPKAKVSEVIYEEIAWQDHDSFKVV